MRPARLEPTAEEDMVADRVAHVGAMHARQIFHLQIRHKFIAATVVALIWGFLSWIISRSWISDLATHVTLPLAYLIVFGIAIIPGYMNAFLVMSLLLDRRPERAPLSRPYPPLTILIAAYQEETNIVATLESVAAQDYPGSLQVIVINDGSTDRTAALARKLTRKYSWLRLIDLRRNIGKARALDIGLGEAKYKTIVTIDADCCLYRDALKNIVERYMEDPPNTAAVAGCILVRNSRESWVTRMQEWDYFHGIAAIKRIQSMYQGTLVAQGAFSLYDRAVLREIGAWPNCVGEDIVMTWAILEAGYRVGHCEDACVFTNVPNTLSSFIKQRQRWSRGMLEAFSLHPKLLGVRRMSTVFVFWNLFFPMLDFVYTLAFLPGVLLAFFGIYWIAGPMTIAVLPLTFLINALMFHTEKQMFDHLGLHVRRNISGLFLYTFCYSAILQPACCAGYLSEMIGARKSWGTK